LLTKLVSRLRYGSQWRIEITRPWHVIKADECDLVWDANTHFVKCTQRTERHQVIGSKDRVRARARRHELAR
jgi:hypothetical protein